MTTNLVIAYPQIPAAALTVTTYTTALGVGTPDQLYVTPVGNLWTQKRSTEWWGAFNALEHNIEFDLGQLGATAANFIAFARMDRIAGCNYYLYGRVTSLSSWTTVDSWVTGTGMNTAPRYGTRARDDYHNIFSSSAAYRYWRIRFVDAAGGSFSARLSKLFFGTLLDLGVEPTDFSIDTVFDKEGRQNTTSGATRLLRARQPRLKVSLQWECVTDTALQAFERNIVLKRERHGFFLITRSFHEILRNYRQVHVKLKDYTSQARARNKNTLTCTFEELIG